MKILRSYLIKECVIPFILALGVLTCVFLLGYLIKLANLVINKGVSIVLVGKIFLLYIPVLLGYTLPIACLIGVILAFSRLSTDNEILAMRASGIHVRRLLIPLFVIGVMFSEISFILNNRVVPFAYHQQRTILRSLGTHNPTALLEPGVFIHSFDGQIIFIQDMRDNKLYNVTIYQPQSGGRPTRTIIAERGEFTQVPGQDKVILKLIDGTSDEPDLKNPKNFYKLNFNTMFITLDAGKHKKNTDKKPKGMSISELLAEKHRLEKLQVDTSTLSTEIWRKITWSFAPLIFIMFGFPLAVITNKREKSANVLMAVAYAAGYYLLSIGCQALTTENIAPAALLMWIPDVAGLTAAIYLNYKLGAV